MLTLRRYITVVSVLGLAALVAMVALGDLPRLLAADDARVWVFVVCLIAGEFLPMRLVHHGLEGEITTSSTFAMALLLTAGMPLTVLAMAIAVFAVDVNLRKPVGRIAFNVGQYALTVLASGLVLKGLGGFDGGQDTLAAGDLAAAVAAAAVFFLVNALLVAGAVSLAEHTNFLRYLRTDLEMQTSTVGILLGLGPVVVVATQFSLATLPLLGLPLLALYRAGRSAVQHQHDALHDPLTGLPNRALLRDRLEQALAARDRDGSTLAVIFVDLDGFKDVNDTLGHHQGDDLLRAVAGRLAGPLAPDETLARLGGDEFAVVLPRVASGQAAVTMARRLGEALDGPFSLDDAPAVEVRASFGVALAPHDGRTADELLRRADIAMYNAKETGGGERRYNASSDYSSHERLSLVAELRESLDREALDVHFQPKASAASREIESVEALVRWPHPRLGVLAPGRFIDLAERSGLIRQVTSLVLERSLRECRTWLNRGTPIGVAVNLSPHSLRDHRIVEEVAACLQATGVPPALLKVEVTEGMLVHDPMQAREVLNGLRRLGVEVSLDDFGTGFSSLAHLKDLPIDEIKIDRSFVSGLDVNAADLAIVRSTISLAHDLGLRVVAEGVETPKVADELESLGCDLLQGYLIGRPIAATGLDLRSPAVDLGAAAGRNGGGVARAGPVPHGAAAAAPARVRLALPARTRGHAAAGPR
jgi:diguanylate cyclase (GGDEF)-like protein